jgi:hypothetical protein
MRIDFEIVTRMQAFTANHCTCGAPMCRDVLSDGFGWTGNVFQDESALVLSRVPHATSG